MPTVAVLLSGCGFMDGAEITEAVLTLAALSERGADYKCCAPNVEFEVVDHLTGEPTGEKRNALTESARIARGKITDVATLDESGLDALIMPGGFGAAKTLSSFASQGAQCDVHPDVETFVTGFLKVGKPIGAICIAPATLARIAGKAGVHTTVTIGNDEGTASAIAQTGCKHKSCAVTEFAVDIENKIVSTPAYMYGDSTPHDVYQGIHKLVDTILTLID
jgi:enhancing lycopene biosynthesis protein 2